MKGGTEGEKKEEGSIFSVTFWKALCAGREAAGRDCFGSVSFYPFS